MNKLETFKILLLASVFVLYCFNLFQTTYSGSKFNFFPKKYDNSPEDVYNELLDIKDFRFIVNSHCFTCNDGFLVVVTVFCTLDDKAKRDKIREYYSDDCIHVVFLVGTTDNETIMADIKIESAVEGDIVQGNFIDTYTNLTYKHIMDFKWIAHHCNQAKFVIKVDDDVTIDMPLVREKLRTDFWDKTNLIACNVYSNRKVIREHSKWAVSVQEFADDKYPDYCNGPVIIYSTDVVKRLLEESRRTPFFKIDDVYVTGILARKIGVVPTEVKKPYWIYFDSEVDVLLDNETKKIIRDGNGLESFQNIYKKLKNSSLNIQRNKTKLFFDFEQLNGTAI